MSTVSAGRAAPRLTVPLTALLALLALLLAPGARASEADTDHGTWGEVAAVVTQDLDNGLTRYQAGDTSGAAAAFQRAYNSGYVASNLAAVVTDRLGKETMTTQKDAFASLRQAAFKTGNEQVLSEGVASLSSSVTQSAAQLDALTDLLNPRDYAAQRAATTATERAALDAAKTQVNTGRGERTWGEVAVEMTDLIDRGVAAAVSGDGRTGSDLVNQAYYGYYEKLGFEKTVMSAISGDRVSQVENQFKVVRKAMVGGEDAQTVTSAAAELKSMITQDAATLDAGAADQVNPVKSFLTSSFGQALIILLREGLEAILVVAAIIAYLIKAGMKDRVKHIYLGILLGLVGSGVVAALFAWLFDSASSHQEILEGVVALIAMLMLLFTSNWMLSKSSVASWNAYIKDRTQASVSNGGVWALASLSFLAVFREGAETVMFYQALLTMDRGGAASVWQGFAVGCVILVAVFLLIRFTSVKIPLRPFFAVTSFLMALLVVIFAGGGVHALVEGDVVSGTYVQGVPTYDYLGVYPYVETLAAQGVMAVVVVVLAAVSLLRRRAGAAAATAASASSPEGAASPASASSPAVAASASSPEGAASPASASSGQAAARSATWPQADD